MNIVELRDRLNTIIDYNNRHWPLEKRNEQPVFVHYHLSKRVARYTPIKYVEGSLYGFSNNQHGFNIILDETAAIEYGRNRKVGTKL